MTNWDRIVLYGEISKFGSPIKELGRDTGEAFFLRLPSLLFRRALNF